MAFIEARGIGRVYPGGVVANDGVDLSVQKGEVHAVVGENGAGKSTLMKILFGIERPDAGTLMLDGKQVHFHRPIEARQAGIEVVYQDLALCDNLTAASNVFLSREASRRIGPFKLLLSRVMNERSGKLFGELQSETRPRDLVRRMSGGQRQAVAIARTRLSEAKIVLMDEPTAAISVRQVAEVLALIHRLKEQGIAVVLISHRIPDIFAVCDRLVVLRRGGKVADKKIADSSPEEVTGLITGAIRNAEGGTE